MNGAVVWLMVDGSLKKCRVSEQATGIFLMHESALQQARAINNQRLIDSVVGWRTDFAAYIVAIKEYELVE